MQEADALHIGDIICLLSASFLDANMILSLQEADGLLYIYFWHAYIGPRPMAS